MFSRWRVLAVAVSAVLLALLVPGIAALAFGHLPLGSGDFFSEVSNHHLASQGIVLTGPGLLEWPATTSASADQTVRGITYGRIGRTVLLHVQFSRDLYTQRDCLCWVISMATPGGLAGAAGLPTGSGSKVANFSLAFVRADSGRFVMLVEEAGRNSLPPAGGGGRVPIFLAAGT